MIAIATELGAGEIPSRTAVESPCINGAGKVSEGFKKIGRGRCGAH